eukprot:591033-Prymnesium_polylepis.1
MCKASSRHTGGGKVQPARVERRGRRAVRLALGDGSGRCSSRAWAVRVETATHIQHTCARVRQRALHTLASAHISRPPCIYALNEH